MTGWSRRIIVYARPQLGAMTLVVVLILAAAAVEALKPWPLKLIVDNALAGQPLPDALTWIAHLPAAQSPRGLIGWLTGMTVVLFLAVAVLKMTQAYVQAGAGTRMMYQLGADLFEHVERLSLRFHSRNKTGDLVQRIVNDVRAVRDLVVSVLLPIVTSVATLVFMFVIMWRLDATLTIVALGVVPLLLLAVRTFAKDMEDRSFEQSELQGQMMGAAEQTLSAIPIVQAFGREPHEDRRFGELTERTGRAYLRSTLSQLWFTMATSSATALGTAAILIFGGLHVTAGRLSIGSLLVFLSYLRSLYDPLLSVAYVASGYAHAAAGARRVLRVLDVVDRVEERPDARDLPIPAAPGPPGLVFDDVTFGYETGVAVLKRVTLSIRSGESVAIVGATGSGKSTLVSLIPRLFDPWSGRLLWDDTDVRDVRLSDLRARIAVVLQEPFLFPVSIAENIAYGRPSASRPEIADAARAAQADRFIRSMPQGYDTVIGERGVTLSGGERQRLAIARAFLKDAPVLLMDEPTAALDLGTEDELLAAMEQLMKGRTSVIVAHRLSTIRNVDRVFVLEAGRVVEMGTEAELLTHAGVYSRLRRLK